MLIFIIFMTNLLVTKFSTHENSVVRAYAHIRVHTYMYVQTFLEDQSQKFEPRKFNADVLSGRFTKVCIPENFPLYGTVFIKENEHVEQGRKK